LLKTGGQKSIYQQACLTIGLRRTFDPLATLAGLALSALALDVTSGGAMMMTKGTRLDMILL
jgi:hypothetical protein